MGKKHASRKYTDLILEASSRWPNLEPSIKMEPGDYGTIDKSTGQFQHEGNIYRNSDFRTIASEYPPEISAQIDNIRIHSSDARRFGAEPDVHTNFFGVGEPSLGGQWIFGRSRGALLLMHECIISSIPNDLLAELRKSDWKRERYIVSSVYSCRGYFLYLSDKSCSSNEKVSVDLRFDAPIPTAPGVTPGAGIKGCWHVDGVSGISQRAFDSEPSFFPLYQVKRLGRRKLWFGGRRGPGASEDDSDEEPEKPEEAQDEMGDDDEENWLPVGPPWGCLDEDGRELTEEFSGDSDTDDWGQ